MEIAKIVNMKTVRKIFKKSINNTFPTFTRARIINKNNLVKLLKSFLTLVSPRCQ
jgi:hypothetical protein